jgi:hypothetical protein
VSLGIVERLEVIDIEDQERNCGSLSLQAGTFCSFGFLAKFVKNRSASSKYFDPALRGVVPAGVPAAERSATKIKQAARIALV